MEPDPIGGSYPLVVHLPVENDTSQGNENTLNGELNVSSKTKRQEEGDVTTLEDDQGQTPIPDDAITNKDVLFHDKLETNSPYNSHGGNKKYQALVFAYADEFASTKGDNMKVVRKVVGAIRGRFLLRDESSGSWFEIDRQTVMNKVEEALYAASKGIKCSAKGIAQDAITNADVLWDGTRGNRTYVDSHVGNKTYRDLIISHAREFALTPMGFKMNVARKVMSTIHAKQGRFLTKDSASGTWFEIVDKKAMDKCAHALYNANKRIQGNASLPSVPTSTATGNGKRSQLKNAVGANVHGLTPIPVEEITHTDVLWGEVEMPRQNNGNNLFNQLIHAHANEYLFACRGNKKKVAKKIVDKIHAKNGRFLEKSYEYDCWIEVSDGRATEKAQKVLCKATRNSRCEARLNETRTVATNAQGPTPIPVATPQERSCAPGNAIRQTLNETNENAMDLMTSSTDDTQTCDTPITEKIGTKRMSGDALDKAPSAKEKRGDTFPKFPIVNFADLEWPFVDGEPSHSELLELKKRAAAEQLSSLQRPVIEIGSLLPTTARAKKKQRIRHDTDTRKGPFSPPVTKKNTSPSSSSVSTSKEEKGRRDEPFQWPTVTWI